MQQIYYVNELYFNKFDYYLFGFLFYNENNFYNIVMFYFFLEIYKEKDFNVY